MFDLYFVSQTHAYKNAIDFDPPPKQREKGKINKNLPTLAAY